MSNDPSAPDKDILRLFYQDYIDRVRDTKQQQWHLTYYSILLYAGLTGIDRLTSTGCTSPSLVNHLVSGTAIVIGLVSALLLIHLHCELHRRRCKMEEMSRTHWPTETEIAFGKPHPTYISSAHQYWLLALMIASIAVGAAFTVWIAWVS